jgi:2-methylcitrate dehydratase PrpD
LSGETLELVEYAAGLRYEDITPAALQAAKNTICDGIGACMFGYRLPWSQIICRYVERTGASGRSSVLGPGAAPLTPPLAALVNGALAHSFELDGAVKPGVGAHPFATIFPAALAVAQDNGNSGKQLLTAFVAATEITLRIGRASKRSNERRGFHAPGTTGPYGGAIAAGLLLGLDNGRLANAMGIAGSLGSGLLQFSQSKTGGMVKRLHFGRAAEGGVMAANLAADGFDGPHDILEGEFGFLRVYCDEFDQKQLTLALGTTFLTEKIYMKRFACHGTTQHALQALEAIQAENSISPGDIDAIQVTATHELVERHGNVALTDIALAQYCLPFCVALACFRDARDPRSWDKGVLTDPRIHDMLKRVRYVAVDGLVDPTTSEVTVVLKGGIIYKRTVPEFPFAPSLMADRTQVYEKYAILTSDLPRVGLDEVFDRVQTLEDQADLGWLAV